MKAHLFLEMLLCQVFDKKQVSLNDHSVALHFKHGIEMTKQGIDDNFTEESVEFVRTLLEQQFHNQISQSIEVETLKYFTAVVIKDSTRFQLPKNLKQSYPGSGGEASEAGTHIQFEFDLLSGRVADLHVTDARHQDYSDANETTDQIQTGSLVLRDMGYFDMDVLEQIQRRGAYYISRLKPKVKLYELRDGHYCPIDLKALHHKMKHNNIRYQEVSVYIGGQKKMPVRLVVELMDDQQLAKRLSKASREAHKKGRTLSDEYRAYASLNLFISNVPEKWLTTPQLHCLYRLRWQIELRFKIWKSYYHIHAIKKMKRYRFETYLYATLLFILINWEIACNLLSIVRAGRGQVLSIIKCFKALMLTATTLTESLFYDAGKLKPYIELLYQVSVKKLLLEKRKCHLSQQEILFQKEFCAVYYSN